MDDAFQTELQDDSALDVAKELLRFYKYCTSGDESTAVAELAKLPAAQPWLTGQKPVKEGQSQSKQIATDVGNESDEEVEKMEEDDGWTEVKTRRQK